MTTWIEQELGPRLNALREEEYIAPKIDPRVKDMVLAGECVGTANDRIRRMFTLASRLGSTMAELQQRDASTLTPQEQVRYMSAQVESAVIFNIIELTICNEYQLWGVGHIFDEAWGVRKFTLEEAAAMMQILHPPRPMLFVLGGGSKDDDQEQSGDEPPPGTLLN